MMADRGEDRVGKRGFGANTYTAVVGDAERVWCLLRAPEGGGRFVRGEREACGFATPRQGTVCWNNTAAGRRPGGWEMVMATGVVVVLLLGWEAGVVERKKKRRRRRDWVEGSIRNCGGSSSARRGVKRLRPRFIRSPLQTSDRTVPHHTTVSHWADTHMQLPSPFGFFPIHPSIHHSSTFFTLVGQE